MGLWAITFEVLIEVSNLRACGTIISGVFPVFIVGRAARTAAVGARGSQHVGKRHDLFDLAVIASIFVDRLWAISGIAG